MLFNLVHAVVLHGEMRRDIDQAFPGQPGEVVLVVVVVVTAPPFGEVGKLSHRYLQFSSHWQSRNLNLHYYQFCFSQEIHQKIHHKIRHEIHQIRDCQSNRS